MDELKQAILDAVPDHTHRLEDGEDIPLEHLPGDINGRDHLHYHPKHHHHGEFEKLRPPAIKYSREIEFKLKKIVIILEEDKALIDRFPPRWLALKVFEGDEEVIKMIGNVELVKRIREVV
jgi:Fe2+ transport system protein B